MRGTPPARNPTLYALLSERIGPVEISAPGEAPIPGQPTFSVQRNRLESTFIHEGEYYRVNCPYCDDTSKRLYVSHLWMTLDPVSGEPMRHLATCFNEGCLRGHYREFEERVTGMMSQAEREALLRAREAYAAEVIQDLPPLGPVPPPGEIVPIDEMGPGNQAYDYLRDRGFDPAELARRWGVGFCLRSDAHPMLSRRIFMPVVFRGDMVGWQGRWPADDWKQQGVQKYYNLRAFRKSWVLYNYDSAIARPCVVVQEGVTDVWATGEGAVATLGKTISPQHKDLLRGWAQKTDPAGLLVLMYDPEAWTDEQTDADKAKVKHDLLMAELRAMFDDRVVEAKLPPGRDPGSLDRDSIRRLLRQQVRAAGFSAKRYGL